MLCVRLHPPRYVMSANPHFLVMEQILAHHAQLLIVMFAIPILTIVINVLRAILVMVKVVVNVQSMVVKLAQIQNVLLANQDLRKLDKLCVNHALKVVLIVVLLHTPNINVIHVEMVITWIRLQMFV